MPTKKMGGGAANGITTGRRAKPKTTPWAGPTQREVQVPEELQSLPSDERAELMDALTRERKAFQRGYRKATREHNHVAAQRCREMGLQSFGDSCRVRARGDLWRAIAFVEAIANTTITLAQRVAEIERRGSQLEHAMKNGIMAMVQTLEDCDCKKRKGDDDDDEDW